MTVRVYKKHDFFEGQLVQIQQGMGRSSPRPYVIVKMHLFQCEIHCLEWDLLKHTANPTFLIDYGVLEPYHAAPEKDYYP